MLGLTILLAGTRPARRAIENPVAQRSGPLNTLAARSQCDLRSRRDWLLSPDRE